MFELLIAFVVGIVLYVARFELRPGKLFRRLSSLVRIPLLPGCLSELAILVVVILAITSGFFAIPRGVLIAALDFARSIPWEVAACVAGVLVGRWWTKSEGNRFALLSEMKEKLIRR